MTTIPHQITLAQATAMTHAFQNATLYQGNTVASMIDSNSYNSLINQIGCVNVRTYFGLDQNVLTIVVVGVDNLGNDMVDGIILDMAVNCPIFCHRDSPLMVK